MLLKKNHQNKSTRKINPFPVNLCQWKRNYLSTLPYYHLNRSWGFSTVFEKKLDLSWCDIAPYLYLQNSKPLMFKELDRSNERKQEPYVILPSRCVVDQDFVKMFHIDNGRCTVSGLIVQRFGWYGDQFNNIIHFANDFYNVSFELSIHNLEALIKTKDLKEFVKCVERIHADTLVPRFALNQKLMDDRLMFPHVWECWRKIIAPKYAQDNKNAAG